MNETNSNITKAASNKEDLLTGTKAVKNLGVYGIKEIYKYARHNPYQAALVGTGGLGGASIATGDPLMIAAAAITGGFLLNKAKSFKTFNKSTIYNKYSNFASYPYFLDEEGTGNNIYSRKNKNVKKKLG